MQQLISSEVYVQPQQRAVVNNQVWCFFSA